MADIVNPPRYQVGDRVRVKVGKGLVGTVTDVQGIYVPGAHILYRVRVPMTSEVLWLAVRDEEIEKA